MASPDLRDALRLLMRSIAVSFTLLISATLARGQCVNIAGTWTGNVITTVGIPDVRIPPVTYNLTLSVAQNGCSISGDFTVTGPSSGTNSFTGSVSGSTVSFQRSGPFGSCSAPGVNEQYQTYNGAISTNASGPTIAGTWDEATCLSPAGTWTVTKSCQVNACDPA